MDFTRRGAIGAAAAAGLTGCRKPEPTPAAKPAEGRIAVPGGNVWWKKAGGGPKTPVLTLHGGPGAGHNYLLPLAALADERAVYFYDQLGCGQADSPPDEKVYTIQRSVDEVDAVRKGLGLEEVVLYGHSWGALLAIEYLCQGRGAGIQKLVIGGAMPSIPQAMAGQQRLIDQLPEGKGKRLHQLEAQGKQDSQEYQDIVNLFYALHVLRVDPPPPDAAASFDILGKSIAYRVMNGPNEFTITGVIKDWDRTKDLGAIKVPTLITTGEFDEVTLDCHQTLNKGIAGSKLEVMPGCSHLNMDEKPADYVALVRPFIA